MQNSNVLLEVCLRRWQRESPAPPRPLDALPLFVPPVDGAQPEPRDHEEEEVDGVDAGAHDAQGFQDGVEDIAEVDGEAVGQQGQPELEFKE